VPEKTLSKINISYRQ